MSRDEVPISDLHLAAFVLARGGRLVRLAGSQDRREFVFQGIAPEVIAAYYGGNDSVSARALLDALRNVRGLISQPDFPGRRAER